MMSVPSTEALTMGNFFSAYTTALTKNEEKPSFTPCFFSNASLYLLRSSITGCMFTSLKVVRIAAFCCDCSRRSAMRWRMRVIGTRCSGRSPAGTTTGAMAGAPDGAGCCTAPSTSSLVTRPWRPLPCRLAASTSCACASLRADGETAAGWAGALTRSGAGAATVAATGRATAAVSIWAMTSPLVTFVPSALMIFARTPLSTAGSSSTTLSVSMSIRFSPSATASPTFLCQVSSVASETDSESCGTLTSTMLMVDSWYGRYIKIGTEGRFKDHLLLFVVYRKITRCRRCRRGPQCITEAHAGRHVAQQVMLDAVPRALIARFFLAPHDFLRVRIGRDLRRELIVRERVELLQPNDRHVADALFTAVPDEIEIHLAAADDDTFHLGR